MPNTDFHGNLADAPPLPPEVERAVQELAAALGEALDDRLAMLGIYGSAARGDHQPARSDLNLLVVLRNAGAEVLDALAPVLGPARDALRLAPFVLTEAELPRAADAFAVKLYDMKIHHRVLAGEDLLAGLRIDPKDLRLVAERELRHASFRLRRAYLLGEVRPALAMGTVARIVPQLLGLLRVLVAWRTGSETPPAGLTDLVDLAGRTFDCPLSPLAEVARTRHQEQDPATVRAQIPPLLSALEALTEVVDRLE